MLFLCTLLLYLPVRNYAFINYDDGLFVYQNPHVLGGLTIDASSGQLGGPPFDSAIRGRVTRAVISRSY